MGSCLQKIPPGNESRAQGENDEMSIPNYRERSRLNHANNILYLLHYKNDKQAVNLTSLPR